MCMRWNDKLVLCVRFKPNCKHSLSIPRIFPTTIRALPRLDLFRRSFLYRQHHAPLHNFDRPVSVAALPDALRSQQDAQAGRAENLFRVASVDCDEPSTELNVFKGKLEPPFMTQQVIKFLPLGSCVGASRRNMSDPRPSLQTSRLNRVLLHSAARDVADVHCNRSAAGPATRCAGRRQADERRVVEWVARNRPSIR